MFYYDNLIDKFRTLPALKLFASHFMEVTYSLNNTRVFQKNRRFLMWISEVNISAAPALFSFCAQVF